VLLYFSTDIILLFNIDVGVVNDYHHLRGEGGGVFIKELYSLTAVLHNFILHIMKGSHTSMMAQSR